jgi:hypothetical protein
LFQIAPSTNPFESSESQNPFDRDTGKADEQITAKPKLSPFHGIIGKCFEQYLYIYIESLDRWV